MQLKIGLTDMRFLFILVSMFFVGCGPAPSVKLTVDCGADNSKKAEVFLNNKSFGECPISATVKPGDLTIEVKRAYEDLSLDYAKTSVSFEANSEDIIYLSLTRDYPEEYYWKKAQDFRGLNTYLRKFPSGKHATEASKRMTALASDLIDNRYYDHKDGTVTDIETGLTWMRCLLGQTWRNGSCVGRIEDLDGYVADRIRRNYVGFDDWRVPTIEELHTLIICEGGRRPLNFPNGRYSEESNGQCLGEPGVTVAVNQSAFPGSIDDYYLWSVSTVEGNSGVNWVLYLGYGNVMYSHGSRRGVFRLVRTD